MYVHVITIIKAEGQTTFLQQWVTLRVKVKLHLIKSVQPYHNYGISYFKLKKQCMMLILYDVNNFDNLSIVREI